MCHARLDPMVNILTYTDWKARSPPKKSINKSASQTLSDTTVMCCWMHMPSNYKDSSNIVVNPISKCQRLSNLRKVNLWAKFKSTYISQRLSTLREGNKGANSNQSAKVNGVPNLRDGNKWTKFKPISTWQRVSNLRGGNQWTKFKPIYTRQRLSARREGNQGTNPNQCAKVNVFQNSVEETNKPII